MLFCKKWTVVFNGTLTVANQIQCISTCCKRMGFKMSDIAIYQNMDPKYKQNILDRKKRKLQKLTKVAVQKIPITDFQVNKEWKSPERKRTKDPLSEEIETSQLLLEKDWSRYTKNVRHLEDEKLENFLAQQAKALNELYLESPALHEAALSSELTFSTFKCEGPVQTLPISNYLAPLGGYVSCSPPNADE
uniref:Large ribosomal subunit protein mL40 n=1 Tax=Phallusia mammillata TaxID=59560 RepID=A0A6F9DKK8_9ASCI|nr:39S ribosomal protein L40, mitochondrial [Phallusia mammillata]